MRYWPTRLAVRLLPVYPHIPLVSLNIFLTRQQLWRLRQRRERGICVLVSVAIRFVCDIPQRCASSPADAVAVLAERAGSAPQARARLI
eukprot:3816378-Prymnesium_polylepis.3